MIIMPMARAVWAAESGGGDPDFADVSLLCHFDSSSGTSPVYFVNNGYGAGQIQANSAQAWISSTEFKFGGFSAKYPASIFGSEHIRATDAGYALGTGDGTVEFWLWPNAVSGSIWVPFEGRTVTGINGFVIYMDGTAGRIAWNNGADRAAGNVLVAQVWQHIAWSRAAGVSRFFVDGNQVGSDYTDSSDYSEQTVNLGATANGSFPMLNSYFDDWRITKGVGRYTTNFTPPTTAFPDF